MTQINLKEEFNHLKIKTPYAPIVCGNKNYSISIDFSNDWSNIQNKMRAAEKFGGSYLL